MRALVLSLSALFFSTPALAAESASVAIHVVAGEKLLNHRAWGAADQQHLAGVQTTWFLSSDPRIGFAVDALGSHGRGRSIQSGWWRSDYRGTTAELALGPRLSLRDGGIGFTLGGGLSLAYGRRDVYVTVFDEDDPSHFYAEAAGPGAWLETGLSARARSADLGAAVRVSGTRTRAPGYSEYWGDSVGERPFDLGGVQLALSVGFGGPY